jgi:sulfatase maturation enzyme AslB (radical SAM superfamily)
MIANKAGNGNSHKSQLINIKLVQLVAIKQRRTNFSKGIFQVSEKMRSATLLIKPSSGNCNLRCSYCFYHDEMEKRSCSNYGFMSLETLEILVKKALTQVTDSLTFAFQGGEPTLSGLVFYKNLVADSMHANFCNKIYESQASETYSGSPVILTRNGRIHFD